MGKFAIIVSYHPNINNLNRLCNSIVNQGFKVIIVDNTEHENQKINDIKKQNNGLVIFNKKNMGIAHAQNLGFNLAEQEGAEIISFFDQDSMIEEDLLLKLQETLELKSGVVCPVSLEENTNLEYPSHKINKYGLMRNIYSKQSNETLEVDIAISSGTTLHVETFKKIGYFDESFFIDFVDIEWCMRARKKGISIHIEPNAIMYHSIGESPLKIGPITIIKHSPIRTYYKVRNSFLLLRKNMKFLFTIRQIIPALVHNFLLLFAVKEKKKYFKYYMKGLCHGIIGKKGQL